LIQQRHLQLKTAITVYTLISYFKQVVLFSKALIEGIAQTKPLLDEAAIAAETKPLYA